MAWAYNTVTRLPKTARAEAKAIVSRMGRPPRADVKATRRIEFVITEEEALHIQRVADENNLRVATLVRDALNEYVADYRDQLVFLSSPRKQ